jgi:predicted small integral membrane protein
VIVGFSGRPDWKIIDEATGAVVFDPVMPTTAPRLGTLKLTAPTKDKVYKIVLNRTTSIKSSWITLGFVDYQP